MKMIHVTWKGIWTITEYKCNDQQVSHDPTLPDTLNNFFCTLQFSKQQKNCTSSSARGAAAASRSAAAPCDLRLEDD